MISDEVGEEFSCLDQVVESLPVGEKVHFREAILDR